MYFNQLKKHEHIQLFLINTPVQAATHSRLFSYPNGYQSNSFNFLYAPFFHNKRTMKTLACPGKGAIRLTDNPDMTIAVDRDINPQTKTICLLLCCQKFSGHRFSFLKCL